MSVESEMKTLVEEKFDNHESEMKQLGRLLREKVDGWRNWRSERGWGNQAPNTAQSTTKTCWQCQTEIDRRARVCPHCRGKQPGNGKVGFAVLCVLGVLMVIGAAGNSGNSSSTSSTSSATDRVRIGETGYLRDKNGDGVLVFKSRDALFRARELVVAGADTRLVYQHIACVPPVDAKVIVITGQISSAFASGMDGPATCRSSPDQVLGAKAQERNMFLRILNEFSAASTCECSSRCTSAADRVPNANDRNK
jgi:hypothetical protein